MVIAQPSKIMYCEEVLYIMCRPPSEKWRCFGNIQPPHAERFICCTLTIRYIIYGTVGRPIASISNLGGILTSALCASVNMVQQLYIYRLWTSLPYYILYIVCTCESCIRICMHIASVLYVCECTYIS